MYQMYDAFEPTSTATDYLQYQLNSVSRSFALVVPCVEPPTRHYLATAYLLCRVVDNIEDCSQPAAWKDDAFGEFLGLLSDPSLAGEVLASWDNQPWPGLTARGSGFDGPRRRTHAVADLCAAARGPSRPSFSAG